MRELDGATLDCDASNYGLRAVLLKEQSGIEKVIVYSSRTMSKPELRYDTTPKELLAIVNGLKQFRQYLTGRHFIIRTDNAALSWLRRTLEPMPQLARWLTFIEEFDYEVVHRDGTSTQMPTGSVEELDRFQRATKERLNLTARAPVASKWIWYSTMPLPSKTKL